MEMMGTCEGCWKGLASHFHVGSRVVGAGSAGHPIGSLVCQINPSNILPGKPVAHNLDLLCLKIGLFLAIVAHVLGHLAFQVETLVIPVPGKPSSPKSQATAPRSSPQFVERSPSVLAAGFQGTQNPMISCS